MYSCSIVSRVWKTTVKTVFSVMILILLHLVLSTPTEAATLRQRAVVRASDGQVYEIQYTKPLNIENFSIRGLDGTTPSRETAAELYIAVQILNNPFTAAHLYSRVELRNLVSGEATHTAILRNYHTLATMVGSVSAGYLVGIATGALEISASLIKSEVGKAALQALTTVTLIVGKEKVATDAYLVTETYIEFAFAKRRLFDELVSSAEAGTEVSIAEIRSAYNALIQADAYVQYAFWMLNEYLVLPDRWERLRTFALTIFPLTAIGQFFVSAGENIEDLRRLQTVFAESDRRILTLAAAKVNATFSEASKSKFIWTLASAGFFERQPPTIVAFIEDMQLMVDDDARLLDLTTKFSDLNGDRLEHAIEVTDSTVADVEFILFIPDGDLTSKPFLEITPKRVGSTSVTIEATDPTRLSATQTFTITVDPAPLPNQPPEAVNTIPTQNMTVPGPSRSVNVASYFSPQSDLIYEADSNPNGIVTESVSGSRVTITPVREGSTSVVVTAFDSNDRSLSAIQTIPVTVRPNSATIVRPPSDPTFTLPTTTNPSVEGLADGVAVIVRNTEGLGLNIRNNPWVDNANKIGQVHDGTTGTIEGRSERDDGFTWWYIDWDGENIEGWCVEAFGGSQLLFPHPPDLEVRGFNVSDDEVEPGETFTIEATVRNNGPGESAATEIFFYYQKSDEDTPRVAGSGKRNVPSLRERRSHTVSLSVEAPMTPGDYEYGAILPNDVDISNNTRHEDVEVTSSPDLVVESISANRSTVDPGERFTLEAVVRNQGIGEPARSATLRYYRSRDANITESDTEVGDDTISRSNLDTNETTQRSESITAPIEPGVYYYGAYVDLRFESNTRNNASSAVAITVRELGPSDLVVDTPTLSVSTLGPGQSLILTATVRNQGIGTAPATTLRGYLSSNANISDVDTEVGDVAIGSLASGATQTVQLRVDVPVMAGTYYYGICVDPTANESNTVNNCSIGVAVTVLAPDLRVDSVRVNKTDVAPGETFRLDAVVTNRGKADSTATTLRYYLSADENISPDDTEVQTATLPIIAADAMREPSGQFTAPDAPGVYYYGICIDDVADETDTENNCSTSVAIRVENRAPSAVGTLPSRTLSEDSTPVAVDVAQYFNDPDNTALTYTAASDNTTVVLADVRGSQVTLTPVGAGDAIVTITASDGALTATQTLSVSVVATPTENEAPVAIGVIPGQLLVVDGASSTVDISAYFSDANGDTLTYAAWPDDKNVVGLRREGTLLTITPKAVGNATVTVRATDPEGLEVFQRFSVFVSMTEIPVTDVPAETWMPDANLRAAVRRAIGLVPNDALTQQAMQALTSLRYLGPDLSDNQKITDLTGLEYALNLEHLDLYMHLISDIRPLERLAKLRSLWFAGNKISNIRPLTHLPLEELDLGGNPITDFAPLAELTSLTRLDFWGNGLGDNNLQFITGLTQLTQLDLRNNQISDISSLTKLVNLKKLQLKGNSISDTSPLLDLTSQNPNVEIDIEISDKPPSEPETEIEAEVPDLVVESIRVNKTAVDPGAVFRLDALIKNQGKTPSGDATVRFYRSADETISTEDTEVRKSDLPSVAVDTTRNKWARLTAPNTAGVYYYGVCIDGVADESDTENNCSTAVKMTVGTAPAKPPVVETPVATDPETGEEPPQETPPAGEAWMPDANLRAAVRKTLGLKPSETLTPQAMRGLTRLDVNLPRNAAVKDKIKDLTGLEHATQLTGLSLFGQQISDISPVAGLIELTILSLNNNDLVSDISPVAKLTKLTTLCLNYNQISDINPVKDLTNLWQLCLTGNQISDINPVKDLTNLTRLVLGQNEKISDIKVLKGLTKLASLSLSDNQISDITALQNLTDLQALWLHQNQISDITPLEGLTNLTLLFLDNNQISDVTPLENLTSLGVLYISGNPIEDFAPLRRLKEKNPGLSIDITIPPDPNNAPLAPPAPLIPDETALLSNYPNPFNPETWIPYQLAKSADVTLTIYDVRGVMVRRLALGHRPAGFYRSRGRAAHWDGRNQIGEKVATGLYFYTLTAGEFNATGKMLIQK